MTCTKQYSHIPNYLPKQCHYHLCLFVYRTNQTRVPRSLPPLSHAHPSLFNCNLSPHTRQPMFTPYQINTPDRTTRVNRDVHLIRRGEYASRRKAYFPIPTALSFHFSILFSTRSLKTYTRVHPFISHHQHKQFHPKSVFGKYIPDPKCIFMTLGPM